MSDRLTPSEESQLEAMRVIDPFAREVLIHLDRIIRSARFIRLQPRAKEFLRWIVAKTLLGQADQIKETTIALMVFEESTDFNSDETSKIRQAAGSLRDRLAAYANEEGRNDVIQILLPLNTYVPDIQDRRTTVTITEFENWHSLGQQQHLCAAIAAEIAAQLCQAGVRAGRAETLRIGTGQQRFHLRGSVEAGADTLRINVSLSDLVTGDFLCSRSFEGTRQDLLRVTKTATEALIEAFAAAGALQNPMPVAVRKRT